MPRYKHITGIGVVQLTPEEETARDAEEAEAKKKQEEYLKVKYKDDRRSAYPDIGDQLDQLYHDMADGKLGVAATTGSWFVGITSVKNAYPKS